MNDKRLPTIERLHELFRLDYETGKLYRKISVSGGSLGAEAGNYNKAEGYRNVKVDTFDTRVHRVVFAMAYGKWPSDCIDHINRDKLDNRPCNLRESSRLENQYNRGSQANNTSGHKGVSWSKARGKWVAQIGANRRHYVLGYFNTPVEAGAAYCKAAAELHGVFASRELKEPTS